MTQFDELAETHRTHTGQGADQNRQNDLKGLFPESQAA